MNVFDYEDAGKTAKAERLKTRLEARLKQK